MFHPRLSLLVAIALGVVAELPAAELPTADKIAPEQLAFFEQKVRPVLAEHCYKCHSTQAAKLKGGLLLDSKAGWEKGGDSGEPAIVPGKPDESALLRVVRHQESGLEMPPEQPKLAEAVIADLATWVKLGAPDPRDGSPVEVKRADKSWWSLQALTNPQPPSPAGLPDSWATSAIDRFVFARLREKGLSPSLPADRRTLIRRVSYDLIGLPPLPEEVEAFVRDDSPRAYEGLVERLLASPRYGEHWGRHWLDVVRFGESRGFERNIIIDDAWPFRDYVIRSFNEDKPFNRFIIEHLAGDAVAKDQPQHEVGVAFLTLGPYDDVGNQDPVAAANIRAATVDDMVTATGSAFLGLSINCARCHHHKFDPIPTEDYYRIKAALDGVKHGSRALSTAEARRQHHAAVKPLDEREEKLTAERAAIEDAIVARAEKEPEGPPQRPAPSAQKTEETFDPVEARYVRFTMLATTSNAKSGVDSRLDEFEVWTSGDDSRNVALAASGAKAAGAANRVAKDFALAYGVARVNDGKYGERWLVGSPPVLMITLAKPARIDRVVFSHDRNSMSDAPISGLGPAVIEYEIHVSQDGQSWHKVADSFDRRPYLKALTRERQLRQFTTDDERKQLAAIHRQLAEVASALTKIPPLPLVWAGKFEQPPKPSTVFRGGDPQKPGDVVAPASPSVLDRVTTAYELPADAKEQDRRLALAEWIASDGNPLTARVLANRVWHYHFGTGIVDTPGDFGFLGSPPTHPELLDWLAHRLQQHGWRLKALHRDIVLSQTYRQASTFRADAGRIDRDARLLWRFPPRRLSAEEIRDTLLATSGKLDLHLGGPGFRLYEYKNDNVSTFVPLDQVGPETYRRAVYHQNARASVVDVLSDFDLPDNAFAAPKRAATTTPLQALTLLNHSFILDMAKTLAARVKRETGDDNAAQIRRLFAIAFQRRPSPKEQDAAVTVARSRGLATVCRAILNANELFFVE